MQQTGSAARHITEVAIADLTNTGLKTAAESCQAEGGGAKAGTAEVVFDTGPQTVEGYFAIATNQGYIADPISGSLLNLNCVDLPNLFNHYARGDYPGAPGTT